MGPVAAHDACGRRLPHLHFALRHSAQVVGSSALCYLIEALGNTEMAGNWIRALLWLRYAQWAFNTPLLVGIVGLLAGTTVMELFYVTLLSWITTGALFAGAISTGLNATWPLYV